MKDNHNGKLHSDLGLGQQSNGKYPKQKKTEMSRLEVRYANLKFNKSRCKSFGKMVNMGSTHSTRLVIWRDKILIAINVVVYSRPTKKFRKHTKQFAIA